MFSALKIKPVEDTAYSGRKVSGNFRRHDEQDLYLSNAFSLEMLEDFTRYQVECEKDGNKNYVYETVIDLARLDAGIWCVVKRKGT